MKQASIIIYDLETGGLADDAPIIQSSIKIMTEDDAGVISVDVYTELHGLPKGVKQDIEAVETHGYTDADLAGLPLFQESKNYERLLYHLADASCFVVGHNILGFDNGMLERDGVEINARIIDTLKVMRHTTHDSLDSYRLSYLHAYKKQAGDESFIALDGRAHDAEFDVSVCWELLSDRMSHGLTLNRMVEISSKATYLGKLGFGKYGKHGVKGQQRGRAWTFEECAANKEGRQYLETFLLGPRTIEWTKSYDGLFEAVQHALATVPIEKVKQ